LAPFGQTLKHHLPHGASWLKRRLLRQVGDGAFPPSRYFTTVKFLQARENTRKRALPGPIVSNETNLFSPSNCQLDIIEEQPIGHILSQLASIENRHRRELWRSRNESARLNPKALHLKKVRALPDRICDIKKWL
jgi:hypothetical protein